MLFRSVTYQVHLQTKFAGERGNSGENPVRSGHCNQGGEPGRIHCTARYEKEGRLLICKSGNLLVCRKVKTSE